MSGTPRRGLGRGLGSLIPTASPVAAPADRPDVEPTSADPRADPRAGADVVGAGGAAGQGEHPVESGPVEPPAEPPAEPTPVGPAGAYFAEVPLDQVVPNERQPRQDFDAEALAELVHSIREVGLLQPVVVRRTGEHEYELVMGERRWRACREAGLTTVPAIVRETDDTDMLRDALLENLHRAQLNPLEEAAAYGQLLEDFSCTHEELAERIGRSRPQISNTLRLLRLSPAVQRRVAAGVLSAGHARALLAVDDPEAQDRLAHRVVAEGISVRGLEELVHVGQPERPARRTRPRETSPELGEVADRLADKLETRVRVDLGRRRGRITVDFATVEDLHRIADLMDPRNRTDRPV